MSTDIERQTIERKEKTLSDDGDDFLLPNLRNYHGASNLAFNELVKKKRELGDHIYHLAFGQSPFPVMKEAEEALCRNAGQAAYLDVAGLPKLREAIIQFHTKFDGLSHFAAGDVVVGPGSKELIFLLMSVFDGDVLLLSPTWTTYRPQAMFLQKRVFIIPTSYNHQWKVTPGLLEKHLEENSMHRNKLLILCNPDNPTGTSYTASELEDLSSCLRKHNMLVLSDEIYARLHFENDHKSLAKYYPEGTILSSGISKWASAGGWRLGYSIFPKRLAALRKAIASAASHTYSCAPAPVQYAALWLFTHDVESAEYMAHTRRILAAVAQYCHRKLEDVGLKVSSSTGGFYMFPDFEVLRDPLKQMGIENCQQMCKYLLDEKGIALMAGGPAFLRPEEELTVRLCFIDFDGAQALEESRKLGLNRPLPEDFVRDSCNSMYLGINHLTSWVEETKKLIIAK